MNMMISYQELVRTFPNLDSIQVCLLTINSFQLINLSFSTLSIYDLLSLISEWSYFELKSNILIDDHLTSCYTLKVSFYIDVQYSAGQSFTILGGSHTCF